MRHDKQRKSMVANWILCGLDYRMSYNYVHVTFCVVNSCSNFVNNLYN